MATAKATVNKVIIVGNLGQEPELKTTKNQASVVTLSLATNRVYQDEVGNTRESVDWHRVVLWGKTAEVAAKYLNKSSKIYVEGSLRTRQWQDKNGETRYTTEVGC
ncbi:MAG: single-stranded DNA-binding protein [Phycisphaerae bacterium]|nr:single-stranded DNA-binding protein [candidate division KSB1 bacterium]NIU99844.1 single-stranded DNA-binding protein [Phycisphaerae bacterium]NIR72017.1 single-stranded DNA-binding protein [candidate division KSB1 bacterium]NIT72247.1 single-stranded DNA-binding protein [candidate division KSB1 bacterium]NIU26056.1 single-stranded DNA-binding protein [candidate division KSB1 bacterium]